MSDKELEAALAEAEAAPPDHELEAALAEAEAAPPQAAPAAAPTLLDKAKAFPGKLGDFALAAGLGVGKGLSLGSIDELSGILGASANVGVRDASRLTSKALGAFGASDAAQAVDAYGKEMSRRLTGIDPDVNPEAYDDTWGAIKAGFNSFRGATGEAERQIAQASPTGDALGQLAGMLTTGGAGAAAKGAGAAAKGFNAGRLAKQGAALSGATGFLSSEGDLEQRLKDAGFAAAIGATLTPAIGGIAYGAPKVLKSAAESAAAKAVLGPMAEYFAPTIEKFREYGRFALDNKLVGLLRGSRGIARRADELADAQIPAMNAAYDEAESMGGALQVDPVFKSMLDAALRPARGGPRNPVNIAADQAEHATGMAKDFLSSAMLEQVERSPAILNDANKAASFLAKLDKQPGIPSPLEPADLSSISRAVANRAAENEIVRPGFSNDILRKYVGDVVRQSYAPQGQEVANAIGGAIPEATLPLAGAGAGEVPWGRAKDYLRAVYRQVDPSYFIDAPTAKAVAARNSAGAAREEVVRQITDEVTPETLKSFLNANATFGPAKDIGVASGTAALKNELQGSLSDALAAAAGYASAKAMGASTGHGLMGGLGVAALTRGVRPVVFSSLGKAADEASDVISKYFTPVINQSLPAMDVGIGEALATPSSGGERKANDTFDMLRRQLDSAGRSSLGAKAFVDSQNGR